LHIDPGCQNIRQMRRGLTALALAAVTSLSAAGAVSASQTATAAAAYRCKDTAAGGGSWRVIQRDTNCTFARYAVRLVIDHNRSPRNWRCSVAKSREFDPQGVPVQVRCHRGSKRVLGTLR